MADDQPAISATSPSCCDRCVELLTPALTRHHADGSGAVLVDATLGAGGHAERFLTELPGLRLIGLDRDPTALAIAADAAGAVRRPDHAGAHPLRRHRRCAGRIGDGSGSVDGVLFDLGVSSMQLDRAERGFAYSQDAPLDMRMDPDAPLTAADILNTYDEARAGRDPARATARSGSPAGSPGRSSGGARATRSPRPASWSNCSTQAIPAPPGAPAGIRPSGPSRRCASRSTPSWTRCAARCPPRWTRCAVGGRIVVMAYQSLEDRIVKRVFADARPRRAPRPACRSNCPATSRDFGSLTRGAETRRRRRDRTQSAQRAGAAAGPATSCRKGRLMKAKREAPRTAQRRPTTPARATAAARSARPARDGRTRQPRGVPRTPAGADVGTTPQARAAEVGDRRPARSPGRSSGPARPRAPARPRPGQRPVRPRRPRSSGRQLRERLAARLASIDLRPAHAGQQGAVRGAGHRRAGCRAGRHAVAVHRLPPSGPTAGPRPRDATRLLQQQKESLERDVLEAQAAPALAEAARNLGMIPSRDTAHLVQDPAGNWMVVGTPKPAEGVPPPPLNAKLPDEAAHAPRSRPRCPPRSRFVLCRAPLSPGPSGRKRCCARRTARRRWVRTGAGAPR